MLTPVVQSLRLPYQRTCLDGLHSGYKVSSRLYPPNSLFRPALRYQVPPPGTHVRTSSAAVDLTQRMMEPNAAKRITIDKVSLQ